MLLYFYGIHLHVYVKHVRILKAQLAKNERGGLIMNIYSRILLAVYAIFVLILSAFTMSVVIWPGVFASVASYIDENLLSSRNISLVLFLIAFVFLILSIIFLTSGIKIKDKKVVSKHTKIGEIKISLDTIENIALTASRKLSGVKEAKVEVKKPLESDNVSIEIKTVVMPDINIPALSEDMQEKVKRTVESSTGITVDNVQVIVENIFTGYRARVE